MIGAIAGDIIGSTHELDGIKTKKFPLFPPMSCYTDDTVMTVAIADAILNGTPYAETMQRYGNKYPQVAYGKEFRVWLRSDKAKPYGSWGSGAAMRVTAIGLAFDTAQDVVLQAKRSAECSHNHEEGIRGAQAAAFAVYMAKTRKDKEYIRHAVGGYSGYNLDRTVDEIRKKYSFVNCCQQIVPEAIICFLDGTSYIDTIRNAVSLGGDGDTIACIAGGIAEAYYGEVPRHIRQPVNMIIPKQFGDIVKQFNKKYKRPACS